MKEGQSYELLCKVDYSNELNTTIQWFHNNLIESNNETCVINEVNVENDHDLYKCSYNDALDSDSVEFELDVQCKWWEIIYIFLYSWFNL